ncbi:Methyltransferase type 11 [Penicillium paradoxum]|uniref:Methyltransferase type 11 n=1 Tax=Penicillium paradoxum TaxID=176176 RepID=UPI002546D00D|nr:Methyltransferase type 11 [Penicillium paradoxum]KAJ5781331.1 Methyltransferase type 11 [Penicillium paradoxum]
MNDTLRMSAVRCPPPRQARGTVLNTIMEDTREYQLAQLSPKSSPAPRPTPATLSPKLRLQTSGLSLPTHARLARLMSPLSAGTTSSCSDTEWQSQMQGFQGYDDLYDASDDDSFDDNETEISDSCFSPDTRPSSLITPITRNSVTSTGSRKHALTLEIPSSNLWPSMNGTLKGSPVPPTPPAKIPVSPAALSMLSRSVPASYAPPSLDGSMSSDQESVISALATPDSHSLPDTNWDAHDIHVRPDLDGSESDLDNADTNSDIQTIPIAIEAPAEDWRQYLGSFPGIPTAARAYSPSPEPSLQLNDEPIHEYDDLYDAPEPVDQGVFLPDSALAMLHHIRLDGTPDSWSETSEGNGEMWQLQAPPSRPRSADGVTPASELSGYSFSDLSIPSPGGFFASLAPRARHTWSIPNTNHQPTSAAAEGFYNLPWRRDEGEIVEQVVEWPERPVDDDPITAVRDEEGPPTAIRLPCDTPTRRSVYQDSPMSAAFDVVQVQEIPRSGNGYEYDECYDQELQDRAVASHDRTSVWLSAQASYLAALNETNPVNDTELDEVLEASDNVDTEVKDTTGDSSMKMVRFAEGVPESLSPLPPILASKDSIYWQGFQSIRERSTKTDGFMHRNLRFDAVHSMRLAMSDLHINCLQGKYEVVRPERPAYKGPFAKAPRNSVITLELAEKAQFAKLEKEQLVLAQLCQPMWAMDALRSLNGGNLLTSPAQGALARTTTKPKASQGPRQRSFRILDLGGHSSCDWAWQAAYEFPNVKVYTVALKSQAIDNAIKGPPNHRQVTVTNLWELPFGNNQFDVISARSLHALLKAECPIGKDRDEYDLVLKECMRCLKPGGYLEFQVLDAEISRAGPYGSATSVEFAFSLRTRGYDPVASKSFLARLRNSGFVNTQRAWMFLPMGTEPVHPEPPRETPAPRVQSQIEEYEAVQGPIGSTADIASVTGLIGGWMWEQWLLKLRVEMGRERSKLLEGVGALFDEGRKSGAGWTCLSGWAMKPKRRSGVSSSVAGSV